jgi:hypothetical protein
VFELNIEDPHPEVEEDEYLREVSAVHIPQLLDALTAAAEKSGYPIIVNPLCTTRAKNDY